MPDPGEHEVVPDLGREGAARHGLAVVLGLHGREPVRVADPDGHRQVLVEAHEPGVAVVLGRARLAGGELADLGRLAGSARDHARRAARCAICGHAPARTPASGRTLFSSSSPLPLTHSMPTGPSLPGASVPDLRTPLFAIVE